MMLINTFVVSFCRGGWGSFNVTLWFLVVCVGVKFFDAWLYLVTCFC